MPFGLVNAEATFQRDIHIAFDGLIGIIILIYFNDLTVYLKKRDDHLAHLRFIFLRCCKYEISLNPTKSIFGVNYGNLLGHIVSSLGIIIDPPSKCKKDIQASIRKINSIRRLIPIFVKIVRHIHHMLKSNQSFYWNTDTEITSQ